ncbi:UNVERIFIED_CONTAM: molecular chaperone DnaK, partial [Kocuria sp. CPCC 205295]
DDDSAVESAVEKLQGSMGKIGEAVYSQDGAEGAAAGEQPAQDEDEDIVDAEVVDDEKDSDSSK